MKRFTVITFLVMLGGGGVCHHQNTITNTNTNTNANTDTVKIKYKKKTY